MKNASSSPLFEPTTTVISSEEGEEEEGDSVVWQRCQLNKHVELEFLVIDSDDGDGDHDDNHSNSPPPNFAQNHCGDVILDFTKRYFSGKLQIRLAGTPSKKRGEVPIASRQSVGRSGSDPGISELRLSTARGQASAKKNGVRNQLEEKQSDAATPKEEPVVSDRRSRVSFHSSVVEERRASDTSQISASSRHGVAPTNVPSSSLGSKPSQPRSLLSRVRERPKRKSSVLSLRTITQMSIISDGGQNELHRLCGTSSSNVINVRKIQAILSVQPELAKQVDDIGRLPLHILGNNSEAISCTEGYLAAKTAALLLMDVHPNGLLHEDQDGRIPFSLLIQTWVEWNISTNNSNNPEYESGKSARDEIVSRVSRIRSSIHKSITTGSDRPSDSGRSDGSSGSYLKFPSVTMFDEVKWCFDMLSIAIEYLGGMPLDTVKRVRPRLAYSKQLKYRDSLAKNIASIPNLLKYLLLLESKGASKEVVGSAFVRRMLFCPEAYGPWIPQMMRQKKEATPAICVDFLKTISNLRVKDFVGDFRKPSPHDERLFHKAKVAVYERLENFDEMIPSLLVMNQDLGDEALATPLFTFIMNRRASKPFSTSIALADMQLNVAVIMAFRHAMFFHQGGAYGPPIIMPVVNPRSVLFIVFANQLLRRVAETILLAKISRKVARRNACSGWNLLDYSAIVFAMVAINLQVVRHSNDINWPLVSSFVLGLLWLKMLGFVKIMNEQMATFILAVTKIIRELRFFFLFFWIFLWMMGDMFRVVFTNDDDISCEGDDLGVPADDFCESRSFDAYLRVYAVVVGDFEYSDYSEHTPVKILWLVLTLFGAVILLNVLIAIVSLSYSKCQDSRVILFRRARAQYIANHSAIENFVIPKRLPNDGPSRKMQMYMLSLFMLSNFTLTISWTFLYFVSRFATAVSAGRYGNAVMLGAVLLGSVYVGFAGGMCLVVTFLERFFPEMRVQSSAKRVLNSMNNTVIGLAGIDRDGTEGGEDASVDLANSQHEELLSRLDCLEKTLADATILPPPGFDNYSNDFNSEDESDNSDELSFIGPNTEAI